MKTARELVDQLNTEEFFSPYQIEDIIEVSLKSESMDYEDVC